MKKPEAGPLSLSLSPCQGRRNLWQISLDDEPWRCIDTSIFGRNPAFPKTAANLPEWTECFHSLELQQAKKYALRQLARRAFTTMELHQALAQKLVSEPTIRRLLDELSQSGLFDDADWIQRFIAQQSRRGCGPQLIKQKLAKKGISEDLIAEHLPKSDNYGDQIRHFIATRYRNRNLRDFREKQKVIAALARRGFHLDDIFAVLNDKFEF